MTERYLTNITKDKALLVELAACLCERSLVCYMDAPMPPDGDSAYDYDRLVAQDSHGCIIGFNDTIDLPHDYSDFWAVYDQLECDGLEAIHTNPDTVLYLLPVELPRDADQSKIKEIRKIIETLEDLLR
jgi:hypothetical protein